MDFNDVLYLLVLIFSVFFGKYVAQITNVDKKQRVCTLAGFCIVLVTARTQCIYSIGLVAVNAFIILKIRRFSLVLTFVFSFVLLILLRYYQCLSGHSNLIQMMLTLKLIGLSYELHDNQQLLSEINSCHRDLDTAENLQYLLLPHSEISLVNIVHYCFCYVGVLTGPYYKYQTYLDLFNPRINQSSHSNLLAVFSRLKYLPFYVTVFLCLSYFYSVQYVLDDSFYSAHTCLYRWWYSLPVFFTFKFRLYIGLLLSEAVAIMVGLGAYPGFTDSRPGQGPTANVIAFRKIALGESEFQPCQRDCIDFNTVYSIHIGGVETEPTLKRTIKLWNTTVQYWMYQNVYRRVTERKLRIPLVFFISALWHGLHSGYYLSICYMPVYLYIEDLYANKLRNLFHNKTWPSCLNALLFVSKTVTSSSLCMCFVLLNLSSIGRYFVSIYFLPFLLHAVIYLGGKYVASQTVKTSPYRLTNNNNSLCLKKTS